MNCGCENMKKSQEIGRIRRLAKALALIENRTVAIWREDGVYRFAVHDESDKEIEEFISPF